MRACHYDLSTKALHLIGNTLVIGGHIDKRKRFADSLINPMYDAFSSQHGQRLTWEARGSIAGWYYCQEAYIVSYGSIHTYY